MEKIINYTLTEGGVSPAQPQCGGVQGEHRATALVFTPNDDISAAIEQAKSDGSELVYRIDTVTAAGEQFFGEERDISLISDPYYLTSPMTCSGLDTVTVFRLILKGADGTVSELYKAQVRLYFEACPIFPQGIHRDKKSKTAELEAKSQELLALFEEKSARADELLAIKVEAVSDKVAASAAQLKRVTELANQTAQTSMSLQQNTEFVFAGGDATGSSDSSVIVDEELSADSIHPVQNRAITERFAEVALAAERDRNAIDQNSQAIEENRQNIEANRQATEENRQAIDQNALSIEALSGAITAAVLAAHPVGSLYWSSDPTEPSLLFGGSWERVKDKFILAAGDSYDAGSSGGEATHTLTAQELPRHNHPIIKAFGNTALDSSNQPSWAIKLLESAVSNASANPSTGSTGGIGYTGESVAHNNMPPYEVYYCWKRVA